MPRLLWPSLILTLACIALASAADPVAITHAFLATGARTRIVEQAPGERSGRVTWDYPAASREGWVLPNGNLLLALAKSAALPGGGVVEVTRDKRVVWEYRGTQDEVNSVQKTAAGTYVLTEAGRQPRLIEVDAAGRPLVQFALQCQVGNAHMQARMARKLADGTYLVPHLLDFAVKQYDRTGAVLAVIDTTTPGDPGRKIHSWPFTAIRLADGNTLVALTNANAVAEFAPDGRRGWQLTNADVGGIIHDACGVQRLPNGNTVIASYAARGDQPRLFEVTPDKRVIWTCIPPDGGAVHHVHVFATDGVALAEPPLR